jgi:hypothetical protein
MPWFRADFPCGDGAAGVHALPLAAILAAATASFTRD